MKTTKQDRINQLTFALEMAKDHLDQYRKYSEEMRKIGRGLYLSSPYSAEWADRVINEALGTSTMNNNYIGHMAKIDRTAKELEMVHRQWQIDIDLVFKLKAENAELKRQVSQ